MTRRAATIRKSIPTCLLKFFENTINQKEFGAYYTRPEMTGYLCERTIYKLVLDRVNTALNRRYARYFRFAPESGRQPLPRSPV